MRAVEILQTIADEHKVSVAEVRQQIEGVYYSGLEADDEDIVAFWTEMPKKCESPTAEEIIIYTSEEFQKSAETI